MVVLVYSGSVVHRKVSKICGHFGATIYAFPELRASRQALHARTEAQLVDMRELLRHTGQARRSMLRSVGLELSSWASAVEREKLTLHSLNLFTYDHRRSIFIAQMWVPTVEVPLVRAALVRAGLAAGGQTRPILNELPTADTPPTFLRTTKFTQGFQGLVDTYGIPRYREINPGAFAVSSSSPSSSRARAPCMHMRMPVRTLSCAWASSHVHGTRR